LDTIKYLIKSKEVKYLLKWYILLAQMVLLVKIL
jgi:hypothetical protein